MELQHGELLQPLLSDRFSDLLFSPTSLLFNVQANQIDMIFGLIASRGSDSDDCKYKEDGGKRIAYPIFVVGGGGRPLTPQTLTLSSPTCSILIPSN